MGCFKNEYGAFIHQTISMSRDFGSICLHQYYISVIRNLHKMSSQVALAFFVHFSLNTGVAHTLTMDNLKLGTDEETFNNSHLLLMKKNNADSTWRKGFMHLQNVSVKPIINCFFHC